MYFPVNIVTFLRISILKNIRERLLLISVKFTEKQISNDVPRKVILS